MHPEVTFTPWEFSMDEKLAPKNNMVDDTAVKFESKLRRGVDGAKAFDSAGS